MVQWLSFGISRSVQEYRLLWKLGLLVALRFLEALFARVMRLSTNLSARPGSWVVDTPGGLGWCSDKPWSWRSNIVSPQQITHKKSFWIGLDEQTRGHSQNLKSKPIIKVWRVAWGQSRWGIPSRGNSATYQNVIKSHFMPFFRFLLGTSRLSKPLLSSDQLPLVSNS